MRKRQRKCFDHGEPIAKIDTRPLAILAVCVIAFVIPFQKVPLHAFHIDLWDGKSEHPLGAYGEERAAGEYQFINQLTATVDNRLTWNDQPIFQSQLIQLLSEMQSISGQLAVEYEPHPNASYDWAIKTLYILENSGAPFRIAGAEAHCKFGKEGHEMANYSGPGNSLSIAYTVSSSLELMPRQPPSGELYEITQEFEPCSPRFIVHSPD